MQSSLDMNSDLVSIQFPQFCQHFCMFAALLSGTFQFHGTQGFLDKPWCYTLQELHIGGTEIDVAAILQKSTKYMKILCFFHHPNKIVFIRIQLKRWTKRLCKIPRFLSATRLRTGIIEISSTLIDFRLQLPNLKIGTLEELNCNIPYTIDSM